MAPSDENELKDMVYTSSLYNSDQYFVDIQEAKLQEWKFQKAVKASNWKRKNNKRRNRYSYFIYWNFIRNSIRSFKKLESEGYDITVADARFAKPIDEDLLLNLYKNHKILFIVEEGSRGGFSLIA